MLYEVSINVCKFVSVSELQKYENFSELKKISPTNTKKSGTECLSHLMPYRPDASTFTIVCRRDDYSAARIAYAIEDCNAHVLNLNVTDTELEGDRIAVSVRVDRTDISSIVRSLQRYDFAVEADVYTADTVTDTERQRVAELLRYIDM